MVNKLNNKGLTAIEILICFSIIAVIVVSMFKVITNFKDKQDVESYKNEITTYKNTVTKTIMNDIIDNGGIQEQGDQTLTESHIEDDSILVTFTTSNGVMRKIQISSDEDNSDNNFIFYTNYSNSTLSEKFVIPKIINLSFNDIKVEYSDDKFVTIKVGFSHPDLGNAYDALNLNIPVTSSTE